MTRHSLDDLQVTTAGVARIGDAVAIDLPPNDKALSAFLPDELTTP
jgi:hypothetical protein